MRDEGIEPDPSGSDPDRPDPSCDVPPSFFNLSEPEAPSWASDELVQVEVDGVYEMEREMMTSQFVLLKFEHSGLPIRIGHPEAKAILDALEEQRPDRPMTHDLLKVILDRLAVHVESVVIDDLWQSTFYAKVNLVQNGEPLQVDARPSDAIAVALRAHAPIFVHPRVFELAQQV